MSNTLTPFAFDDALVRVHTDENGNPWFVARDICRVLEIGNTSDAVSNLDEDEKGIANTDTPSGHQQMLTVSESGLYSLIFRSRKPEARRFRKWVTGEVLPAIRRTGGYTAPSALLLPPPALPEMSDAMKRLRPLMRERVLSDAIASARITGASTQEEIDALFLRYCALVADTPEAGRARLPGMPFAGDAEAENIRRFADECLLRIKGNRIPAFDVYNSFRSWWRAQFDAALPPQRRFGLVLGELFPKFKRGGRVYYANVAFNETI